MSQIVAWFKFMRMREANRTVHKIRMQKIRAK